MSTFFVGQATPIRAEEGPKCNEDFFVQIHDPVDGHVFEEDQATGSVSIQVEIGVDWTESGTTNNFSLGWVKLFTTNPDVYPNRTLLAEKTSFNNQTQSHIVSFTTSSSSYVEGDNILIVKALLYGSNNSTSSCESAERNITIIKDTPDNSSLVVFIEPTSLSLTVDQHGDLEAFAYRYENGNYDPITSGVDFVWTTTLGRIDVQADRAVFSSSVEGTATLRVKATYQSKTAQKEIYIYVTSPSSGSSGDDDIPLEVINCVKRAIGIVRYNEISSGQSSPTEEENKKFYACFDSSNIDITDEFVPVTDPLTPEIEQCLKEAVGLQRFYEINSGQSRPTAAEREKGEICFSKPSAFIPGTFAPIEPDKEIISALRVLSDELTIEKLTKKTVNENEEDLKKEVLELTGKATANKKVYVYIFSEPLVFLADVDEDGNWTYTLEDPLDPGNHEVYVTMEESTDEFVRSDVFLVGVAQAAPTDTNPSGSSFDVNNNFLAWRNFYLIYVLLGISAGVAGALFFRKRLLNKKNISTEESKNPAAS